MNTHDKGAANTAAPADHANTVRKALPSAGSIPAKDALDILQAQAEATEREHTIKVYEILRDDAARAEAAEAERDRLRDALQEARDWIAEDDPGDADTGGFHAALVTRLDAALAGEDKP